MANGCALRMAGQKFTIRPEQPCQWWPTAQVIQCRHLYSYGSSGSSAHLEMEAELGRQRTRRDVVRAAEGGEEVVERVLVGDVDGSQLETHFVLIAAEEVVMPDGNVEKASRRNARRVLVVVFRVWLRHI